MSFKSNELISSAVNKLNLDKYDNKDKSFYMEKLVGSDTLLVIRVSNHRTHLQTWADRYKPTLTPSNKILRRMGNNLPIVYRKKIFYSFVFEDELDTIGNTSVRDNRIITVNEIVTKSANYNLDSFHNYVTAIEELYNSNRYNSNILGNYTIVTNRKQESFEYKIKTVLKEVLNKFLKRNKRL